MSKSVKAILGIILFALVLGIAYFAYTTLSENYDINSEIKLEDEKKGEEFKALDFAVYSEDESLANLSDFFGKPIVLNFWASWCPPCKGEMPYFERVYNDVKDDVVFMMVSLIDGQRETVATATKYIQDEGYTFPVYFDKEQTAAYTYRVSSIPTTVFINAQGNIEKIYNRAIDESSLRKEVENILK